MQVLNLSQMALSVQLQARCGLGQISGFLLKSYISTQQTIVSVFLQTLTEGLKHTLATLGHDNQNCINNRKNNRQNGRHHAIAFCCGHSQHNKNEHKILQLKSQ